MTLCTPCLTQLRTAQRLDRTCPCRGRLRKAITLAQPTTRLDAALKARAA